MKERDVDDRVYASYVTQKMGSVRDYDKSSYEQWSQNTYRQIREWLPEDKSANILDAGCGHGNLLHLLSSRGYHNITGVDRSPEQVELAREIIDEVQCADIFGYLEKKLEAYDLVVAFDLIEHFRKTSILKFLDLVFQSLRSGGSLILQTPNADSPHFSSIRYGDVTHKTGFNVHSMENMLQIAGFRRFEAMETGPVIHGVPSALRWLIWQAARSGIMIWNIAEMGRTGNGVYTRVFRARAEKP